MKRSRLAEEQIIATASITARAARGEADRVIADTNGDAAGTKSLLEAGLRRGSPRVPSALECDQAVICQQLLIRLSNAFDRSLNSVRPRSGTVWKHTVQQRQRPFRIAINEVGTRSAKFRQHQMISLDRGDNGQNEVNNLGKAVVA